MDYTWQEKREPTIISKLEGIKIILDFTEYDIGLFSLASLMFCEYANYTVEAASICIYLAIYMYCDEKPHFREVVEHTDNALCTEMALDIIQFYNWKLPMFTFVDMLLYVFGDVSDMEPQIINAVINRNTSETAIFYALIILYKRRNMKG